MLRYCAVLSVLLYVSYVLHCQYGASAPPLNFFVCWVLIALLEQVLPWRTRWNTSVHDAKVDSYPILQDALHVALGTMLVSELVDRYVASHPLTRALQFVDLSPHPFALQLVVGFLLSELTLYCNHRAFHVVSKLWPYHAVHHSVVRLCSLNNARFHPVNSSAVMLVQLLTLTALGVEETACLVITHLSIVIGFLSHANLDLQTRGSVVSFVLNTPHVHRLHHAPGVATSNSNYGENIMLWDVVFGTHRVEPHESEASSSGGNSGVVLGRQRVADGVPFRLPKSFVGQLLAPLQRSLSVPWGWVPNGGATMVQWTSTNSPARGTHVLQYVLWSQVLSELGTGLSGFALRVWLLQRTNSSLTAYAGYTLVVDIPGLILLPWAGYIADRFDKKLVVMVADGVAALGTCALLVVAWQDPDRLSPNHLYAVGALSGVCGAFQYPSFQALLPQVLAKDELLHANGLLQLSSGLSQLVTPAVSGVLLQWWGLVPLLVADLVTCAAALVLFFPVTLPDKGPGSQQQQQQDDEEQYASVLRSAAQGARYITQAGQPHRGLLLLLALLALSSFVSAFIFELIPPLVLSFSDATQLGYISSVAGVGMLMGSLGVSSLASLETQSATLFVVCGAVQGIVMLPGGLPPTGTIIGATGFLYLLCSPVVAALSTTILQLCVPQRLVGRVFAVKRVMCTAARLAGVAMVGPLVDSVFEPLMSAPSSEAGASHLQALFGVGKSRGMAVLFVLLGVTSTVAWALAGWSQLLGGLMRHAHKKTS